VSGSHRAPPLLSAAGRVAACEWAIRTLRTPLNGPLVLDRQGQSGAGPRPHGTDPRYCRRRAHHAGAGVMMPIPGTSTVAHLEENVDAALIELSPDQVCQLDAAT
jgi:hypothetical protein